MVTCATPSTLDTNMESISRDRSPLLVSEAQSPYSDNEQLPQFVELAGVSDAMVVNCEKIESEDSNETKNAERTVKSLINGLPGGEKVDVGNSNEKMDVGRNRVESSNKDEMNNDLSKTGKYFVLIFVILIHFYIELKRNLFVSLQVSRKVFKIWFRNLNGHPPSNRNKTAKSKRHYIEAKPPRN